MQEKKLIVHINEISTIMVEDIHCGYMMWWRINPTAIPARTKSAG
jgi:hypothetical protein